MECVLNTEVSMVPERYILRGTRHSRQPCMTWCNLNWSQRQAKHLSLGSKAGACRCEVSCACSAFAVAWLGPVWPRWVGGGGRIGQAWSGLGMLPAPPPSPRTLPLPARPPARPPAGAPATAAQSAHPANPPKEGGAFRGAKGMASRTPVGCETGKSFPTFR